MNHTVLEFECVGMDNGGKFPIEYTGRGQDISPEFVIKCDLLEYMSQRTVINEVFCDGVG